MKVQCVERSAHLGLVIESNVMFDMVLLISRIDIGNECSLRIGYTEGLRYICSALASHVSLTSR